MARKESPSAESLPRREFLSPGKSSYPVGDKVSVEITNNGPHGISISGYVRDVESIKFHNMIGGKWSVGTSICLPSNPIEAMLTIESFNAALDYAISLGMTAETSIGDFLRCAS